MVKCQIRSTRYEALISLICHKSKTVKITVAIVTHKRRWALPHSLLSLTRQSRRPDEVIIVLKPSGDGSEEVVRGFTSQLPLRLLIQERGNAIDAYQMAIDNARGDVIAFLDDDAIAEDDWLRKYSSLFESLPNAGGIGGIVYKAYIEDGELRKTNELFYHNVPTKKVFYRRPLPEYLDYVCWISRSGFMGMSEQATTDIFKSVSIGGVNMAFRREPLSECRLAELYRRSRKAFLFEQLLAHHVRRRGYDVYGVRGPRAPVVWHIVHGQSLTRGKGFWHEFWLHYDRVANYWRLKKLGSEVSSFLYLAACIATLRVKTLPRLLATIYAWIIRV